MLSLSHPGSRRVLVIGLVLAASLPAGCREREQAGDGDGPGQSAPSRPADTPEAGPVSRPTVPAPPDPATVAKVEDAIGRIRGPRSAEIPILHEWVRAAGEPERAAILATLIRHYDSEKDPEMRQACLSCLLPFGREAVAVTRRALRSDADPGVRARAALLLGEMGGPEQIDDLFQAVLDDEGTPDRRRRVAAAAIAAIGEIGGAKAAEVLDRIWKIDRMARGCREAVLVALGYAGDPAGIRLLAEVLGGQDGLLRPSAVVGLGTLVRRKPADAHIRDTVMPILRGRIGDADANVRGSVASALGWVGDAEDIRRLEGLMADDYKVTTTITLGGQVQRNDVYPVREEARKAIDRIQSRLAAEDAPR